MSIDLKQIAADIIVKIDGMEAQASANINYYRGAKDGVKTFLEAIDAAVNPRIKLEEKDDGKPEESAAPKGTEERRDAEESREEPKE